MKNIYLWGAGKGADALFEGCNTLDEYNIIGIIDNDKNKWGKDYRGFDILRPDVIENSSFDKIIITTQKFYNDIKKQIVNDYPCACNKISDFSFFSLEAMKKRYANTNDIDILECINYANKHGLNIFNYSFTEKYDIAMIKRQVQLDMSNGLHYILRNNKKVYFTRSMNTADKVAEYYISLLIEQDENSPHRYLYKNFNVDEGDVVVDVGAAEGIFAVDVIDKASLIYIIEANSEWIEPLEATFKPYKNKTKIIQCFASSYDDGDLRRLDSVINTKVNFIKMDIEGAEFDAINGARRIISEAEKLKMDICEYHSDYDQFLIDHLLNELGFSIWHSKGYMWFPYKSLTQTNISTRLHKGLVFGKK